MKNSSMSNSRNLKISISLIALAVVLAVVAFGVRPKSTLAKEGKVELDSQEQIVNYLKNNSNIFSKNGLQLVTPQWPKEYLYIDAAQKQLIYVNDTNTTYIAYEDIKVNKSNLLACKKFHIDSSFVSPVGFDNAVSQCAMLPLDSVYAQQITANAEHVKGDSTLSKIYNLIVGDADGHLLLGNDGGNWKLYRISDFPIYTIDVDLLRDFARKHRDSTDLSPQQCYNNFIKQDKELSIVYYNIRLDSVIEQNGIKKHHGGPLMHPLDSLKKYIGWVNYKVYDQESDQTTWKFESAYDYYFNRGRTFVAMPDSTMASLAFATWTKQEETSSFPFWFILFIALSCISFVLSVFFGVQYYRNNEHKSKSSDIKSPRETEIYQNDLQKVIDQKEKEIKQLKQDLETFKMRKQREIAQAKEQAVQDYIQGNNIENELIRAKNWKKFVSLTSPESVHNYMTEIKKKHASFAIPVSINMLYDEAKTKSSDPREQMRHLFHYIDWQVDSKAGWTSLYDETCKEADYAHRVRETYEAMQQYVKQLSGNGQLQAVIAKANLNYWDRLALSRWALEGMNQLLATFKQPHLTAQNLSSVQNTMLSDLFQQYVSRIFMDSVEQGKTLDQYRAESKQLIEERIAKLKSEYSISYQSKSDEKYVNACQTLDNAYDDIAGTKAFVDIMDSAFVSEFYKQAETNKDKGWYFAMMVGMGYHMVDFVRRRTGVPATLCPNYAYLLSNFDASALSKDAHFVHNDYAHSVEYTNRVYEWLDDMGVKQLKALVGRQLIKP